MGFLAAVLCCADADGAPAQDQSPSPPSRFRLRVSWGGGQNQSWRGAIVAATGTVSDVSPLGLDQSLANTARVTDQRTVSIAQKVATNYDGFDFTFNGDPDSYISIRLSANDGADSQVNETLSVRSLMLGTFHKSLDDLGNRLTILRAPGDTIKVQFDQDHLVFSTGSTMSMKCGLNHSGLRQGAASMRTSIVQARQSGPVLWSKTETIDVDIDGSSELTALSAIPLPTTEGVYDLMIEVDKNWLGMNNAASKKTFRALNPQIGLLRRRVQFVVLSDQRAQAQPQATFETIGKITPSEIAPAGPNWRIKSHKQKLAILGNQKSVVVQTDTQPVLELAPGGWQAIRLPTLEIGTPHIVEVEYPEGQSLSLGVSVLDASDQGQVPLQGADSGIHVPNSIVVDSDGGQQMQRHRITFWPNSQDVYLLLANQSSDAVAQLGTIYVLAGPRELPIAEHSAAIHQTGNRKRLAYYQSPSFMDDFGVRKFFDPVVGQSLDDWGAFYQGTTRLVAYLKSNHYQGAVLTVTADGSSIYPDVLSGNTPGHDSGVFLSEGQDPFRKDILRMMLKMFERENLTLIPAFAFSHPLTDIEAQREALLSPQPFDVVDSSQSLVAPSDRLPRYNPLDESVQVSVINTLRRFTQRYRGFGSLGGITLICQPNTYTMLPGSKHGNNPHSVNQFLASFDAQTGEQTEARWVQWQADQMTRWYQAIADLVTTDIDQGQLFIAPVGLYETDEAFSALCPNLHATVNFEQLMKRFGFDRAELTADPRIVLLDPQTLATAETLSASRAEINANESRQVHDFYAAGGPTGTIFNHRGLWAHFAQLQSQPPFSQHTGRLMRRMQLTPAGRWNRQRYSSAVRQQDSQFLIDGGRGLAQGQEESLRNFATTFARLPRIRFSDVQPRQHQSSPIADQSVVVRQSRHNGETYVYAVNDCPWEVTVAIQVSESNDEILKVGMTEHKTTTRARFEYFPLSDPDRKQIFDAKSGVLAIRIPAFDIAAGKLTGNRVSVEDYSYQVDQNIQQLLRKRTYALQAKLNLAKNAAPLTSLENVGFESSADSNASSWDFGPQTSDEVLFDNRQGHESSSSLRLTSQGDPVWIRSNRFSVPDTGRISVTAYLKIEDPETQPPLRIAIEGETQNATYYRFGVVGSLAPESSSKQIKGQWRRFAVHFDDLPASQLRDLRIGFDLMGRGTVWVDNVAVHDRWFDGNDARAITQLLAGAAPLMEEPNSFESCRRILEGYWPRFLDQYIDIESASATAPETIAQTREPNSGDNNIFKRVKSNSPSLLRRWRSNLPQR